MTTTGADTSLTTTPTGECTQVVLPGLVEPGDLRAGGAPMPHPGPTEAVVRVEATGVSFAEQQMRRGKYFDQPAFPFVPGYDLVGVVTEVGSKVEPSILGSRYAAITKTGAWATHTVVPFDDLMPVPDGIDPAEAETLVVNGVTAWQMLHRIAQIESGQTVLVHGANGGVGTTLVQLARIAGVRVIGTASPRHHDALRALGVIPVDYRDADLAAQVRQIAPAGVDAVFDHIGGPGIVDSYSLLGPKGTLVCFGTAATKNDPGNAKLPILVMIARLLWWNALPNGKRTHFFNLWAGRRNRAEFVARLRQDLDEVFALLASGQLQAQVAARLLLSEIGSAVALAESGTVTGKVVLLPQEPTDTTRS